MGTPKQPAAELPLNDMWVYRPVLITIKNILSLRFIISKNRLTIQKHDSIVCDSGVRSTCHDYGNLLGINFRSTVDRGV